MSSTKPLLVTASWDDGHKLDLRLAALLKKYGVKATFYISPEDREFPADQRLTDADIRAIAKDFEIGAHTLTHPHLAEVDEATARAEIGGSKQRLEKITGRPVRSFCYPYGSYNDTTRAVVAEQGFAYARTVQRFMVHSKDRLAAGTSVDTYDHRRDGLLSVLRRCGWRLWRLPTMARWDNLAKQLFQEAREQDGVFHLWGHSHEIEAHGDWQRLETFLAWLSQQENIRFVTNGEVPITPPKVLVTAPYFKPHSGGLEEYAYQITSGLQAQGWETIVATSGGPGEVRHDTYGSLIVHRLPYQLRLSNTPFGFGWRRALKRLIVVEQPDVVVAHAPVPGMLDATASAVGKLPLAVTYHMGSMKKGYPVPDTLIALYERLVLPLSLRKARAIICASTFVQQGFLARYTNKSAVINPGVDTDSFKPASRRPAPHSLMHIGGLKIGEEHKGLETSIRVVARLLPQYPDVHLQVVGNGDNQAYFETLVQELGLAGHVTFRGRLAGKELVAAYRSAQVLLAPSRKESFGMAIVEAMACGLPVVAGAVDGVPLVVRHEQTGFLVAPDDVAGFTAKVSLLFDDPALVKRLSLAARQVALRDYQWTDKITETHRLLLRLAGLSEESSPVPGVRRQ
jgi:glycosyltransferase involved in cell wall biosynthesis